MKKDNKKALYESIMTSVAKEVKKALNESNLDKSILINKIKEMSEKLYRNGIEHVDFNGEILVRPNDCILRPGEEPLDKPIHIAYLNTYWPSIEYEEIDEMGYNYVSDDLTIYKENILQQIYEKLKSKMKSVSPAETIINLAKQLKTIRNKYDKSSIYKQIIELCENEL